MGLISKNMLQMMDALRAAENAAKESEKARRAAEDAAKEAENGRRAAEDARRFEESKRLEESRKVDELRRNLDAAKEETRMLKLESARRSADAKNLEESKRVQEAMLSEELRKTVEALRLSQQREQDLLRRAEVEIQRRDHALSMDDNIRKQEIARLVDDLTRTRELLKGAEEREQSSRKLFDSLLEQNRRSEEAKKAEDARKDSEIARLRDDLGAAQATARTWEFKVAAAEAEVKSLREQLQRAKQDLYRESTESASSVTKIRQLSDKLAAASAEIASLRDQVQKSQELIKKAKDARKAQRNASSGSLSAMSRDWDFEFENSIREQLEKSEVLKEIAKHEYLAIFNTAILPSKILKSIRQSSVTEKLIDDTSKSLAELLSQMEVTILTISQRNNLLSRYEVVRSCISFSGLHSKKLLEALADQKYRN